MRLKNISLITSFLLLGTFFVLSFALMKVTDMLEIEANELAQASESIQVAQSLKNRLLTHNRNSFLYHQHKDQVRFENRAIQRQEINDLLKKAYELINREEERSIISVVQEEINEYLLRRDSHENEPITPLERYNLVSQDVDNAIIAIDKLIDINRSQMNELITQVHAQNQKADQLSITLLGIGILLVIGIVFGTFMLVTRPLAEISNTISNYKAGKAQERLLSRGLYEVKVIASNFNSMADWLEEKRQDQLRFIASIAHDLRNPLNSMSMASEVLLSQSQNENIELSQIIFTQVQSLDRLVGDLLDTTRIEAGQLSLSFKKNNLTQIIQDSVKLFQTSSRIHQFRVEHSDRELLYTCDSQRISQVLGNLLSNAVKYSPNGGEIKIESKRDAQYISISVTDSGLGIDESDFENIFKPFHRTKTTKNSIPGIGLGLSASRRIIEAHGGTLKVTSAISNGSTFSIYLPRES